MLDYLCDKLLGLYGLFPVPHRGRDRLTSILEKQAKRRWTGVRSIKRRGFRIETDLTVDDVGWILYSYGCLDYWDERAIKRSIGPGSVCFDVGAHIGYYSLLLSKLVGPTGRVISFEPMPYTNSFLRRNLQNNNIRNVTVEQAAVGVSNGSVRMGSPSDGRLGQSSISDSGSTEVRCTTIDLEVARLGLDRLDFIKMDVEGFELQALTGASRTIHRFRPKIMFEVNARALQQHGAHPDQLGTFFKSKDYNLFEAKAGRLVACNNLAQGPSYFNIFALPHVHSVSMLAVAARAAGGSS